MRIERIIRNAVQPARRIVQIGAGASTDVNLDAAVVSGYQPEIVCIELMAEPMLTAANRGWDFPGSTYLLCTGLK